MSLFFLIFNECCFLRLEITEKKKEEKKEVFYKSKSKYNIMKEKDNDDRRWMIN